jgi:Flp pilus assembly pilin Flp
MMRRDMSPGRWERGKTLTFERARADNPRMRSPFSRAGRRARHDERGQALVEFALIAPLFLMLVIGVIQFGVGLNFWFDMQRLANQGARAAVVNCGENATTQATNLCLTTRTSPGTKDLEQSLLDQIMSKGNDSTVEVCYIPPTDPAPAGWTPTVGDAVRVTLKDRYRLQAVVRLAKIDLTAQATMRLEQVPNSPGLPDYTNSANWVLAAHGAGTPCRP